MIKSCFKVVHILMPASIPCATELQAIRSRKSLRPHQHRVDIDLPAFAIPGTTRRHGRTQYSQYRIAISISCHAARHSLSLLSLDFDVVHRYRELGMRIVRQVVDLLNIGTLAQNPHAAEDVAESCTACGGKAIHV